MLDSLELGQLNKPRGMYPRIALFEHEPMKKMIDITSVNMGGGEISFHGASVSPRKIHDRKTYSFFVSKP